MRRMRLVSKYNLVAFAVVPLVAATSTLAFAQNTGAGAAAPAAAPAAPSVNAPLYTGFVAPPTDPNAPIGGGNATESSSRPVTGDKEDGFDLGPKSGAGGTAFGTGNGPIFMGGRHADNGDSFNHGTRIGTDTRVHTVRRGDTLWDICDAYFKNPYQWPRLWSYNPEIENPHWIFPGEQIRLYPGAQLAAGAIPQSDGKGGLVTRARTFGPESVFLRDTGFIESSDADNIEWGTINGSREDKLFLTDYDETYVHIGSKHNVNIGDELTVFRKVRQAGNGDVIQIQGTLRIDDWNPKERMARARIIESLDPHRARRGGRACPAQVRGHQPGAQRERGAGPHHRQRPPPRLLGDRPDRLHRPGSEGGSRRRQPDVHRPSWRRLSPELALVGRLAAHRGGGSVPGRDRARAEVQRLPVSGRGGRRDPSPPGPSGQLDRARHRIAA